MFLAQFGHHIPRVRHQLGSPLRLGGRDYRVRGYLANRQSVTPGHEPHLMDPLARALATHPGPVVDVGANTGQTLMKVLSLDPDRTWLGIEPQIACCFWLQQFIADNALGQARILALALSDRDGMAAIRADGLFDEMAVLEATGNTADISGTGSTAEIPVVIRTGDGLLADLGLDDPGVIKIDVEGGELEVLKGFRQTLARARPALFFEVLPNFTGEDRLRVPPARAARNTARAGEILALLTGLGYAICQIDDRGARHPVAAFDLDDRAGFRGRDYVAVAGEAGEAARTALALDVSV